jgi:pimeloyl-ACP methyl ester carboxylesterase
MKTLIVIGLLLVPSVSFGQQPLTFGRFKSRAIFGKSTDPGCHAALVVMVPGSGVQGPEEIMQAKYTADGKDHAVFGSFSSGLLRGGVGTLAIGKPGVDFFTTWDQRYYDKQLFENLGWQDLIDNLRDAVDLAKTLPCVDVSKIYVLGHSEGTQVAVDFVSQFPEAAKGLIFLGFAGESLATTLDWQLFRRSIDAWLAPDVDANHDGSMSKEEASQWPGVNLGPNQESVTLAQIEKSNRANPDLQKSFQQGTAAKIWSGVFNRPPLYAATVALKQDIFAFTGSEDVQTRPEEALKLREQCAVQKKKNCYVELLPGLGHVMSLPRAPRKQKFLDQTLGPVDAVFLDLLAATAVRLQEPAFLK